MSDFHEGRPRSDSTDVAFRKIFIGGLSYSTDEDKLKKYFKHYGAVQDAVVMKDPVSKRSRGFGFITFYDMSSVDNALANEPHTIDGRKVEAKRAVPRSEMNALPAHYPPTPVRSTAPSSKGSPSSPATYPQMYESHHAVDPRINMEEFAYNKIFVGGLHYDTRDAEFRAYFERYGRVISAEVMFNRETHKSRGFGFIVFEVEEGAERVCAEKEHIINGKIVEVKRAIPRSKITDGSPPTANAVRSNVHGRPRTMSTPSPILLSGNSSTLAASSQKAPAAVPASAAARKPYSMVSGAPSARGTSYAAALVMGPSHHEEESQLEVRPSRAFSEPIVVLTGSSVLNGIPLPFDEDCSHGSRVGVIQPSSNNSSRSSSIAMPSSFSNNLPWLSSPSTMPFDSSDLPADFALPPARVCADSSSMYYEQELSEQDDRRTISSGNLRMRASSLGALASLPTPESWAALMASHVSFQESELPMLGIGQLQQQDSGLFPFLPDNSGESWAYSESQSLFGEASTKPFSRQPYTPTRSASEPVPMVSSAQFASSLSDLRMDSTEFNPLGWIR